MFLTNTFVVVRAFDTTTFPPTVSAVNLSVLPRFVTVKSPAAAVFPVNTSSFVARAFDTATFPATFSASTPLAFTVVTVKVPAATTFPVLTPRPVDGITKAFDTATFPPMFSAVYPEVCAPVMIS